LFDDAHVGEQAIRGQYTLRLRRAQHTELYRTVLDAVEATLDAANASRLRHEISEQGTSSFLCPPSTGSKIANILNGMAQKVEAANDQNIGFPYYRRRIDG
jgi:hypothetical protein